MQASGGVLVFPGTHPTWDAQLPSPYQYVVPLSVEVLNQEFPQWDYVEVAPNLIGFLDPNNPSRPIVWTTIAVPPDTSWSALIPDPVSPSSPMPEFRATVPKTPGNDPPNPDPPPPSPSAATPEPGLLWLIGAGLVILGGVRFQLKTDK